jgi:hypothetical protein
MCAGATAGRGPRPARGRSGGARSGSRRWARGGGTARRRRTRVASARTGPDPACDAAGRARRPCGSSRRERAGRPRPPPRSARGHLRAANPTFGRCRSTPIQRPRRVRRTRLLPSPQPISSAGSSTSEGEARAKRPPCPQTPARSSSSGTARHRQTQSTGLRRLKIRDRSARFRSCQPSRRVPSMSDAGFARTGASSRHTHRTPHAQTHSEKSPVLPRLLGVRVVGRAAMEARSRTGAASRLTIVVLAAPGPVVLSWTRDVPLPPDAAGIRVIARNLARGDGYTESFVPFHPGPYESVRHLPTSRTPHAGLLAPLFAWQGGRERAAVRVPSTLATAGIVGDRLRASGGDSSGRRRLSRGALVLASPNLLVYSRLGTDYRLHAPRDGDDRTCSPCRESRAAADPLGAGFVAAWRSSKADRNLPPGARRAALLALRRHRTRIRRRRSRARGTPSSLLRLSGAQPDRTRAA